MEAKSQLKAAVAGSPPTGSFLVSLGGIDTGLVTLLGLAGPLVVVPAPLLSPEVPPAGCLGSAAMSVAAFVARISAAWLLELLLEHRGEGERPRGLSEAVAAATVSLATAAVGNLPPYWAQMSLVAEGS